MPPRLVAVGGLSGSGKSTVARAVAPGSGRARGPGAAQRRHPQAAGRHRPDGAGRARGLCPGSAERVYGALRADAATALAAGRTVIVDAVHARPDERAAVEEVARRLGVPFAGIWLDAPAETLVARVAARVGDVSDATPAVVRHQLGYDLGPMAWQRVPAAPTWQAVAGAVATALGIGGILDLDQGAGRQPS